MAGVETAAAPRMMQAIAEREKDFAFISFTRTMLLRSSEDLGGIYLQILSSFAKFLAILRIIYNNLN